MEAEVDVESNVGASSGVKSQHYAPSGLDSRRVVPSCGEMSSSVGSEECRGYARLFDPYDALCVVIDDDIVVPQTVQNRVQTFELD